MLRVNNVLKRCCQDCIELLYPISVSFSVCFYEKMSFVVDVWAHVKLSNELRKVLLKVIMEIHCQSS